MKIKIFLAICACKASVFLLRLMGRGGTAIPGKIALKIYPELLGHLGKNVRTIIITGTNGKTTSARMAEEIFAQSGLSYFANRSGANLINGITAEFVSHSGLLGKPKKTFALIEADEAASKEVCRFLNPEVVLVTNVFRDQLDRYGEVTNTLDSILGGVENSPEALVCLNADCSLTVSIAEKIPNKVIFYGVSLPIYEEKVDEVSDAPFCIRCKHEYEYSYHTFGHLGGFFCSQCGYKRPEPDIAVTEILSRGENETSVMINIFGSPEEFSISIPGGYNIYNAAGALAISEAMGLSRDTAKKAISDFSWGFGRMEQFDMGKTKARMILVKNTAGCNQVINYLGNLSEKSVFVFCLNDHIADGTDISWIWDVNFEKLCDLSEMLESVYVCGIRSADMAVRLKYAGIDTEKLRIFEDYGELISAMGSQELPLVIIPTYTAMMALREKMSAAYGGKQFWE